MSLKEYNITVITDEPINGYWDGGAKKEFEFSVSEPRPEPNGFYVEVGSWDANYWFTMGAGRKKAQSDKAILRNAQRKLSRMVEKWNGTAHIMKNG
jgi:hypothetical protein